MNGKRLYIHIGSDQDLLTLLASRIVEELRSRGIEPMGFRLGEPIPGLQSLLEARGIGLKQLDYARSRACRLLAKAVTALEMLAFYARNPAGSTLHVKSAMGYKDRSYNLPKYVFLRTLGKLLAPLGLLRARLVGLYFRCMSESGALDAAVLSLDYTHTVEHLELARLCRRLGKAYVTYVTNIDQLTNYPARLDLFDRILVWGSFHESVLVGRYGLRASRVAQVGFCRSDTLAGLSKPADRLRVVYFCASVAPNDCGYEENLTALVAALEASGSPYELTLKRHPDNLACMWEKYQAVARSLDAGRGRIRLVGSAWEKYRRLEPGSLKDKDFTYRDLRELLACATHAFSATSTTCLEAAIAGVPAYFLGLGKEADGCFRFEHMRCLVESGMVPLIADRGELPRVLSVRSRVRPGESPIMVNVGRASAAFALEVDAVLFPSRGGGPAEDSVRELQPADGEARTARVHPGLGE